MGDEEHREGLCPVCNGWRGLLRSNGTLGKHNVRAAGFKERIPGEGIYYPVRCLGSLLLPLKERAR